MNCKAIRSILLFGVLAAVPVLSAEKPSADVEAVLDKYHSSMPTEDDLSVYRLDWVPSLDDAKHKAAREERPILLIVVTNSYGNLYTGHC